MTNTLSQFPVGTTGTFTVLSNGSVKLDLVLPAPQPETPKNNYGFWYAKVSPRIWHPDYKEEAEALIGNMLKDCRAPHGYINDNMQLVFTGNPSDEIIKRYQLTSTTVAYHKAARMYSGRQPTGMGRPHLFVAFRK